jgi:anti-sigma regulatory factor (Ser/Thr protein kinase)
MSLEPLDLALPRDPRQLGRFRATLGDWLGRAGVNDRDRDEIILAANEAVTNGIEHSDGDGEVRVRGQIDDHAVTVTKACCATRTGPHRLVERSEAVGGFA